MLQNIARQGFVLLMIIVQMYGCILKQTNIGCVINITQAWQGTPDKSGEFVLNPETVE